MRFEYRMPDFTIGAHILPLIEAEKMLRVRYDAAMLGNVYEAIHAHTGVKPGIGITGSTEITKNVFMSINTRVKGKAQKLKQGMDGAGHGNGTYHNVGASRWWPLEST